MKTNRWIVALPATLLMVSSQHARASHGGTVTRLLPAGQMHAVMHVLTMSGAADLVFVLLVGMLGAWLLANHTSARRSQACVLPGCPDPHASRAYDLAHRR